MTRELTELFLNSFIDDMEETIKTLNVLGELGDIVPSKELTEIKKVVGATYTLLLKDITYCKEVLNDLKFPIY